MIWKVLRYNFEGTEENPKKIGKKQETLDQRQLL